MELEKLDAGTPAPPVHRPHPRQPEAAGEGCLVVAIRLPVRVVVFLVVLPVRLVWDACAAAARWLDRAVFRPLGRALLWTGRAVFVWPLVGLWRHVLVPLGGVLARLGNLVVVVPAGWLYRYVLVPVGQALVWLYARVLTPLGHGVMWGCAGSWPSWPRPGSGCSRSSPGSRGTSSSCPVRGCTRGCSRPSGMPSPGARRDWYGWWACSSPASVRGCTGSPGFCSCCPCSPCGAGFWCRSGGCSPSSRGRSGTPSDMPGGSPGTSRSRWGGS